MLVNCHECIDEYAIYVFVFSNQIIEDMKKLINLTSILPWIGYFVELY